MPLTVRQAAKARAALIDRDGPQCAWCGVTAEQQGEVLCVDHVQPESLGGSHDLDNLQLLCGRCNAQKGAKDAETLAKPVRFASGVAQAGFTVAHNAVLFDGTLHPSARLIYFQLRHYAWLRPDDFPGQEALAENVHLRERAYRQHVRALEQAGLLRTERRGRGLTNAYVLYDPTNGQDRHAHAGLDRQPSAAQTGTLMPVSDVRKTEDGARKRAPRARKRDPLFDELAARCGYQLDRMTKEAARLCGIATSEIRAAGGEPADIERAVMNYRRLYTGAAVTPKAIANHWPAIAPKRVAPPCPDCGVGGGHHTVDCARRAA